MATSAMTLNPMTMARAQYERASQSPKPITTVSETEDCISFRPCCRHSSPEQQLCSMAIILAFPDRQLAPVLAVFQLQHGDFALAPIAFELSRFPYSLVAAQGNTEALYIR